MAVALTQVVSFQYTSKAKSRRSNSGQVGENVFVSHNGQDLGTFDAATRHWKETNEDIYVFYQVLSRIKQ